MKQNNQIFLYLWLAALITVFIGSLYPIDKFPDGAPEVSDKILHLSAYFIIAGLGLLASTTLFQMTIYTLISLLFGVVIEFLQPITGRGFEVADMVANASGIVIALILHQAYFRVFDRK